MLDLQERPNVADAALDAAALHEEIVRAARRVALYTIKARARRYLRDPLRLETITQGLSMASPRALIATGLQMIANERAVPRRQFGFGGEVPAINARAIILVGRWRRAAEAALRGA